MACFEPGTIIDLTHRENVSLHDVRGTTLRVTRGSLWITQEDDPNDVVLRAGDTWVVEKDGLTIIEAQEKSTVCAVGRGVETLITSRREPRTRTSVWWTRVREAASFYLERHIRTAAPHL